MIMNKYIFIFILVFSASAHAAPKKTWKIGMPVCLTGDCASDGDASLKGAMLAAKELNQKGGVLGRKIEIIPDDSADAISGARAVTSFKKLSLDKEIKYFIGPTWSPGGLALAPIVAKERDKIIVSPSLGISDFHKAGENIFNARGVEEAGTRKLAKYAYKKGFKTAVVLSSQQPWELAQGIFFKEEFEKLGGKVLAKYEPLPSDIDVKTEILKTVKLKPDVIFFSAVVQLGLLARELVNYGYDGPKLAAWIDEVRIKDAKGGLEGVIIADFLNPSEEFIKKYKKAYNNETMPLTASTAYDTIMLYAKAIKEARTFDVKVVSKKIKKTTLLGVSGKLGFDMEGCAVREPQIKVLVGEKLEKF